MKLIRQVKFGLRFLFGFCIGSSILLLLRTFFISVSSFNSVKFVANQELYEQNLSDYLFDKVKILCLVNTIPKTHKTKAIHVKNTWGKQCNKLLFISTGTNPNFDTINLHLNESRQALRRKIKGAFLYAYENHLNEFDWFLKADDDK